VHALALRAGAVDAPPRFVGVVVSQKLIRPLAEIVGFLKPAEGGNLQGAPASWRGDATSQSFPQKRESVLIIICMDSGSKAGMTECETRVSQK